MPDDEPDLATEFDTPSTEAEEELIVTREVAGYRALLGEDTVAVMRAREDAGVVTITSLVVDSSVRERGIATALIAHVLDELREAGSTVVPECPEVTQFLKHYPEYADLRA